MNKGQHEHLMDSVERVFNSIASLKDQLARDCNYGFQISSISSHSGLLEAVSDEQYNYLLSDLPDLHAGSETQPLLAILNALSAVEYDDGQANHHCRKFAGTMAIAPGTLKFIADVNAAKVELESLIEQVFRSLHHQSHSWRDKDKVIKSLLKPISTRLCYRQLIRQIPVLEEKPLWVRFLWKSKPSIIKKSALQWLEYAGSLNKRSDIPIATKTILNADIQSLKSIDPDVELVQRRSTSYGMIANARLKNSSKPRQISMSLPLFYVDDTHTQHIAVDYRRLFIKPERKQRPQKYATQPSEHFPYLKLCMAL
jgi:hypothetical protein